MMTASPLHIAASRGNIQVARLLIGAGATLNITNAEFNTPLLLAARHNHRPMVELLLDSGANVNAVDTWLRTPIMRGCYV